MKLILLPTTALVILFGCAQAPIPAVVDNREADVKAIVALEETGMQGWAERNGDKIASVYSPDASLYMANTPTMKGSELKGMLTEMLADPNMSVKIVNTKTEVAKSGEIGYTRGTYTLVVTDAATKKVVQEKGRYVTVFAKQSDGSWKAVEDINTPDAPAVPLEGKK